MRALVMDFGKDRTVENIGDQYMFGPALMVCPVYEYGARSREVYFPATTGWYDLHTGKHIEGGHLETVDAPYERMPLYFREGTIMPCGPDIEYVDEKLPQRITLYVYGGGDGTFTLYEDEGVNYNYEQGAYTTIPIAYDEASRTLVIGRRSGSYTGMLAGRTFNVVFVDKNNPRPFDPDARGVEVAYTGEKQIVKL
jgi:alpha-D-xyloside xylohydrolase